MMKHTRLAALTALLAMVISLALVSCSAGKASDSESGDTVSEDYSFLSAHKGDETYTTDSTVEETDTLVIGVHVPVTNIEAVDTLVTTDSIAEVSEFKQTVGKLDFDADKSGKAVYYSDWVSSSWGDRYISVLRKSAERLPDSDDVYTAKSYCYDTQTGKLVSLGDMAVNSTLSPMKTLVMNAFSAETELADYLSDQANENKIESKLDVSSAAFTLGDDAITLYFDQGALFPDTYGLVSAKLYYGDVKSLMKQDMLTGDASLYATSSSASASGSASDSTSGSSASDTSAASDSSASGSESSAAASGDSTAVSSSTGSYNLPTKEPVRGTPGIVCLTFDDGPKASTTKQLLATLDKYGVKATFFTLGLQYEDNKETLKMMADAGHEIGIHSYGHKQYSKLSAEEVSADIEKCRSMIKEITGYDSTLVRTPYGERTQEVLDKVDYPVVLWDVDPEDWKYKDADTVAANVLEYAAAGDIILMHDIYQSSVDAVDKIISTLQANGFTFMTVSEMMAAYGKTMQGHEKYCSAYN